MKASLKDGKLTIVIDADDKAAQPSKSGKTRIVASSRGNVQTGLQVNGKNVVIGVNAYVPV